MEIDPSELRTRLAFLRLEDDGARLEQIHDAIDPAIPQVVDAFYAHLHKFEALRGLLKDEATRDRLKTTLRRYLATLGRDMNQREYLDDRLRIGAAHEAVGLPLKWYLGAYAPLFDELAAVVADSVEPDDLVAALSALYRVFAFDSILAAECYHETIKHRLEEALDKLERAHEKLREFARRDGLTKVLGRAPVMEALEGEVQRAVRYRQPFALMMVDLDAFKAINDAHGHPFGDFVLRRVADLLRGHLRPWDVIGRYGGDEFVVGLPGCRPTEAYRIGDRLRHAIATTSFEKDGRQCNVTVSIGIATHSKPGTSLEHMLLDADAAMYSSKRGARGAPAVVENGT